MGKKYDDSWKDIIKSEFKKSYMQNLSIFVQNERRSHIVFPPSELVFNAFALTPFDETKVVILGQDPYHNVGQAHGLSFSVPKGIVPPPSLKNIYKELEQDIEGFVIPRSGDLTSWASQGVLLLNATLTVRAHQAASHQKQGWESFTDNIIKQISQRLQNVVFLLWGSYAAKKEILIDTKKHLVLKSVHPSPLSAHRGFFGCKHFSKANQYLIQHNRKPIHWQIHD